MPCCEDTGEWYSLGTSARQAELTSPTLPGSTLVRTEARGWPVSIKTYPPYLLSAAFASIVRKIDPLMDTRGPVVKGAELARYGIGPG
jgi:hypothetical protein